jgi:cytochrome b pre-mRNA-processing protein 3
LILAQWRARRASRVLIEELRGEIVAAARRPALYETLGASDRIDVRFELLTLHSGLVLRRLAAIGGLADEMAQDLVNCLFMHFDDTLREMGYPDVSVSKRLKKFKEAFYGRNLAYANALDSHSGVSLAEALARNVYGGDPQAERKAGALATYVAALEARLSGIPLETFAAGAFRYPEGPTSPGT